MKSADKGSIKAINPPTRISGEFSLRTSIQNDSDRTWLSSGPGDLHVAYHWLDTDWNIVVLNGIRTDLPIGGIPSGGSAGIKVHINPPPKPGEYHLCLALVSESERLLTTHVANISVTGEHLVSENPSDAHRSIGRNSYYFYHIPKTAGTSLSYSLKSNFAVDHVCPAWLWSQLLELPVANFPRFQLFCGHFYSALAPFVGRSLQTFTFIREPISRALSHYKHIERSPEHYLHAACINAQDLEHFMEEVNCRAVLSNFQCRALNWQFDPSSLAAGLSAAERSQFYLEQAIETMTIRFSDDHLFERAKNYLDTFFFVGVSERYSESIRALSQITGWHLPFKELNKATFSPRLATVGQRELEKLRALNQADLMLYDYAQSRLNALIEVNP